MKAKSAKNAVSLYLCLAKSIEENGLHYIQLIKSIRKKVTEESVHEIRVTARKLEAGLVLLDTLGIHQPNLKNEINHVRKIHGPLRNIHIELESIKKLEEQVKSRSFKHFLQKQENKLEKKLLKDLKHTFIENQQNGIIKLVTKLLRNDTPTANSRGRLLIATHHQKITKDFEKIKKTYSQKSVKSIHNIRITAKQIRYQSEILKPALNFENIDLRKLKYFQDLFGEIQNNFVLHKSINNYLKKKGNKGSKSVLELQTHITKRQNILYNRVSKKMKLN